MMQKTALAYHKGITVWLLFSAFLVLFMIVIGGITRLTDSGLSIVEWNPIAGILPPLTLDDWETLFVQYKTSPEFLKLHPHMNLDEFKSIFWWEYIHRILGRIIGIVFLLPFLFFVLKRKISKALLPHLLILFLLGAAQGYMGWYMVKSGLIDDPYVSPIRLMLHLGLALFIYAYMITLALKLNIKNKDIQEEQGKKARKRAHVALALTGITILSGALVAGLDAGLIYNTFPLMNGMIIPHEYAEMTPFYLNFFHNPACAQFNHRILALLTFGYIWFFWLSCLGDIFCKRLKIMLHLILLCANIQIILGIFTLIFAVPVTLGVLHQLNAIVLFTTVLCFLVTISKRKV